MEFVFTLRYKLSDQDCDHDAIVERLGAAGCTDALVGIGQPGRLALEFTRESDSAEAALASALADVKKAVPTAHLIEASPDLVGLTDVADLIGVTRQNMRKLWTKHALSFPPPMHEGSAAIWHLSEVLSWLQAKGPYRVQPATAEVAAATMQVNLGKAVGQMTPRVRREIRSFVE